MLPVNYKKELFVISIIYFIIILSILILVHEGGHFFFAKLFKVRVNEFSLGMGPVLLKKQKGETLYSLRALPIGGFVKMEGEDENSEDERAFNKLKVFKKIIIVIAGAILNIILGFLILVLIVSFSAGSIATQSVNTAKDQPALKGGDVILEIDKNAVYTNMDIPFLLSRVKGDTVDLKIKRGTETIAINDLKLFSTAEGKKLGIITNVETKNVLSVASFSAKQTVTIIRMVWLSLIDLVTGKVGIDQASGPVGMTTAVGAAAKSGWQSLFLLVAFITINLGVFNLLPIPALDGGRLIFLLVEAARRKPVKPEYEGYVHLAGFVLLMLLMVVITYNDIIKLFKG